MKSFELLPTEENLIKTMEMNLLKRNRDLIQFYNLLLLQEGPCAIALDGRWGSGKTFFVKQTMQNVELCRILSNPKHFSKKSLDFH